MFKYFVMIIEILLRWAMRDYNFGPLFNFFLLISLKFYHIAGASELIIKLRDVTFITKIIIFKDSY